MAYWWLLGNKSYDCVENILVNITHLHLGSDEKRKRVENRENKREGRGSERAGRERRKTLTVPWHVTNPQKKHTFLSIYNEIKCRHKQCQ